MNKFKPGDKVFYISLRNERIDAVVVRYRRLKANLFGNSVTHVVAELDNGDFVNSRFLQLIK